MGKRKKKLKAQKQMTVHTLDKKYSMLKELDRLLNGLPEICTPANAPDVLDVHNVSEG